MKRSKNKPKSKKVNWTKPEKNVSRAKIPYAGNRYGDARILKAVKAARGRCYTAALKLGCNPKTIYDAMHRNQAIADAIKEEREIFIDQAEDALQDAVKDREPWAVIWTLKTIGRSRGYTETAPVQQIILNGQQQSVLPAASADIYAELKQLMGCLLEKNLFDQSKLIAFNGGGSNGDGNNGAEPK